MANVKAGNAIVHVIDMVLVPDLQPAPVLGDTLKPVTVSPKPAPVSPKPAPASTILSVATSANLTTLVAAIAAVRGSLLAAVQNSSTAVTVFAPTEAVRLKRGAARV